MEIGQEVGFQVRFTGEVSRSTKVNLIAEGIRLAEIQRDKLLRKYNAIIIERSSAVGFLPCVNREDPFTRRVREVYRANVVAAPRAGIDPLDTLAVRSRSVSARGALTHLLDGPIELPEPEATPTAGLSGTRSTSVDLKLGLDLTAKFLTALGVPVPGAEVTASLWQGATRLNFHVEEVTEHQVDIAELGSAMRGRRLARTPATEVFFSGDGTGLHLITGTLTTTSFAVHGEAESRAVGPSRRGRHSRPHRYGERRCVLEVHAAGRGDLLRLDPGDLRVLRGPVCRRLRRHPRLRAHDGRTDLRRAGAEDGATGTCRR